MNVIGILCRAESGWRPIYASIPQCVCALICKLIMLGYYIVGAWILKYIYKNICVGPNSNAF